MRDLKLVLLAVSSVLFLSCSKEKPKPYSELIIGKWNIVSFVTNSTDVGQTNTETYGSISTMEFTPSNTLIVRIDTDENEFISPLETQIHTYSLENNKVTLGTIFRGEAFDIKTLTTTSMVLFQKEGQRLEHTLTFKK